MGLATTLRTNEVPFDKLLEELARRGMKATVAMVDRALVMPGAPVPPTWQDVRLRTPAGLITLARSGGGAIQVVVMGNAGPETLAARDLVAECAQAVAVTG